MFASLPSPLRASSICCIVSSLTPLQEGEIRMLVTYVRKHSEDHTSQSVLLVRVEGRRTPQQHICCTLRLGKSRVYHSMHGIASLQGGINTATLYLAVPTLVHSLTHARLLQGKTTQQQVCCTLDVFTLDSADTDWITAPLHAWDHKISQ